MQTNEEIANDILSTMEPEDREYLRQTEFTDRHRLHHGFGTWIRNTYKLWERKWVPELIDGVDYSSNHPDAISMQIIEILLNKVKE